MIITHPVWFVYVEMNGDDCPRGRWDPARRTALVNPPGVRYRLEINAPTAADALTMAAIAHGGRGTIVEIVVAPPCQGACQGVSDSRCITCNGKGYV